MPEPGQKRKKGYDCMRRARAHAANPNQMLGEINGISKEGGLLARPRGVIAEH
jgi:hypothetical protein